MYPAPIARDPWMQTGYRLALLLSLGFWLLPIFAVAFTSIRSLEDIQRGNLWGWPTDPSLFGNYAEVLTDSAMHQFIENSFLITAPAVAATIALSVMAAFALAKYRFPGRSALLAVFIAVDVALVKRLLFLLSINLALLRNVVFGHHIAIAVVIDP